MSRAAHRYACWSASRSSHCVRSVSVVIEPCTAAFIRVRGSTAICKEWNVVVEPLASLLDKHGCAALPSVHAPSSSEFFVPIANASDTRVEIPAFNPFAAIAPDARAANFTLTSTAATNPQLSRNVKLRNVLRELQVDALPDSTHHKRSLVSLVCKYLDILRYILRYIQHLASPRATLMLARQDSRFTRSTRQTCARSNSLCVGSRTAKCAKQSRRRLKS